MSTYIITFIFVVLLIIVAIMRPRMTKHFEENQKRQEFVRKINFVLNYTQKQAIDDAKREVGKFLAIDASASPCRFKSSKKFEAFNCENIINGSRSELYVMYQKKQMLSRQLDGIQHISTPSNLLKMLPSKPSALSQEMIAKYNDAKTHHEQLIKSFWAEVKNSHTRLATELQSVEKNLEQLKLTTTPSITLSKTFPNCFIPLMIPELDNLEISINGIGRGMFRGTDICSMYEYVDVETCTIDFGSMIWHLYLHELLVEEKDNIAILSYKDIQARFAKISHKSSVAKEVIYQQIELNIQGKNYTIELRKNETQLNQNETPYWLYAIINCGKNEDQDVTMQDIAYLALNSNLDESPIAQKYLIRKLLIEKMISVKGGEMEQGYKYRVEFFPYNDHRKKMFTSDQHGERIVKINDFMMSRDIITEQLWYIIYDKSARYMLEDPITNITYNDVQQFITKINQITGLSFRLPTENEWEYAARGGKKSKGYLFAGSNDMEEARKSPNELGFMRMTGCIWQMCDGAYIEWSNGKFNEEEPYSMKLVARGGSANSIEAACYPDGRKCDYIVYKECTMENTTIQYVPDRNLVCPPNRYIFGRELGKIKSKELGFRLVL